MADFVRHHQNREPIVFSDDIMIAISHVRKRQFVRALPAHLRLSSSAPSTWGSTRELDVAELGEFIESLPVETFTVHMAAAEMIRVVEEYFEVRVARNLVIKKR